MVCCVGVRYKSYCSNIVRTYMVNPTEDMKANYEILLKVFDELCVKLQHGRRFSFNFKAFSHQRMNGKQRKYSLSRSRCVH